MKNILIAIFCIILFSLAVPYAIVAISGMPILTAIYSVLSRRIRVSRRFLIFSFIGTLLSFGFLINLNISNLCKDDIFFILAVFSASLGYIEGKRLSRKHSGKRITSWAIIIAMIIVLLLGFIHFIRQGFNSCHITSNTWIVALLVLSCIFGTLKEKNKEKI